MTATKAVTTPAVLVSESKTAAEDAAAVAITVVLAVAVADRDSALSRRSRDGSLVRGEHAGANAATHTAAESAALEAKRLAAPLVSAESAAGRAAIAAVAMTETVATEEAGPAAIVAALAAAATAKAVTETAVPLGQHAVEQARGKAHPLAEVAFFVVVAVRHRRRVHWPTGRHVDRVNFGRNRVVERVVRQGRAAHKDGRSQGDRKRHPSHCSDTHFQSL